MKFISKGKHWFQTEAFVDWWSAGQRVRMQQQSLKLALNDSVVPLPSVSAVETTAPCILSCNLSLFQCVFQLSQQVSPEGWTLQRSAWAVPESYWNLWTGIVAKMPNRITKDGRIKISSYLFFEYLWVFFFLFFFTLRLLWALWTILSWNTTPRSISSKPHCATSLWMSWMQR